MLLASTLIPIILIRFIAYGRQDADRLRHEADHLKWMYYTLPVESEKDSWWVSVIEAGVCMAIFITQLLFKRTYHLSRLCRSLISQNRLTIWRNNNPSPNIRRIKSREHMSPRSSRGGVESDMARLPTAIIRKKRIQFNQIHRKMIYIHSLADSRYEDPV